MINLKILTGKPLKPGSFTERILGANIFSMLTLNTVNSWKHVVSIEEQMRPDIISDYYYNNPNYLDVLCIILEYLQYLSKKLKTVNNLSSFKFEENFCNTV
jgi:hypothetical protein